MIQKTFNIKPISINKCFQGRRYKTKDYKDYEKSLSLLIGDIKQIKGDVSVIIELFLKNDKRSDIDNPTKPILDFLTKVGAYEDDRKIRELSIYKNHAEEDYFRVTISEYE